MYDKKISSVNTIIGESIIIRGKLKGDENLVVRGRIEADISSKMSLYIEETGVVKATVQAQSVVVNGVLVGDVHAKEMVEIASSGRMVGNIRAPRVIICDGAAFRGRVDMDSAWVEQEPEKRENNLSMSNPYTPSTQLPQKTGWTPDRDSAEKPSSISDAISGEQSTPSPEKPAESSGEEYPSKKFPPHKKKG